MIVHVDRSRLVLGDFMSEKDMKDKGYADNRIKAIKRYCYEHHKPLPHGPELYRFDKYEKDVQTYFVEQGEQKSVKRKVYDRFDAHVSVDGQSDLVQAMYVDDAADDAPIASTPEAMVLHDKPKPIKKLRVAKEATNELSSASIQKDLLKYIGVCSTTAASIEPLPCVGESGPCCAPCDSCVGVSFCDYSAYCACTYVALGC